MSDKKPLTVLERHVSYFDVDADGQITIAQTYRGLRNVGVPFPLAVFFTALINGFLGFLTQGKLSTKISVKDIAKGKHPFDTGSFDTRGERDRVAFEQLFSAPTTREPRDRLTVEEIRAVIVKRGDPKKPFGEFGSLLSNWFSAREIELLLCAASDCNKALPGGEERRAISRRTLERFYSGELLFLLARRRRIAVARGLIR